MSLAAVVFLPHPPLLLRENAGAIDVAAGLRSACVQALREALAQTVGPGGEPRIVVLTGRGRSSPRFSGPPLGVRVGRQLLDAAGVTDVAAVESVVVGDAERAGQEAAERVRGLCQQPGPVLLVVLADGSARRDEGSPGLPDERARAFDERFLAAVGCGDAPALAGLAAGGSDAELLLEGRPALRAAGRAITELPVRVAPLFAELHDDLGVAYVVGGWRCESC
ncbi:hypothetical protein BJY21_002836 [Kineosphaera limosa]|uniref:Extradiol ring-cleavage dioxygenase class III enzyme subunit B domain-containing protein n=1 Tax=Kineosphaera limosa NBRC 100340 TaxID=1184609 RepID=K6WDU3_9MICO|nr:hypothetical protein [Kineosphaera limosa]NYE01652.1 hypothetical protein [Kineosphaera limosa]GAB97455.1 hypothetical protein KILIM_069_00230 [Kineosphaera limosa NBRC 100340]